MTDTTPLHSRRWNLFWSALIALISIGGFAAIYFFFNTLPPPFAYTRTAYEAYDPLLCPGESLVWEVEVKAQTPPYAKIVNRGIYSVDKQTVVGYGGAEVVPILYNPGYYKRTSTFTPPLDLPPGKYELHNVANTENSTYRGYLVPFSVLPPEECAVD